MRALPPVVTWAYSVFMAVWIPVYWLGNGPANFLWLCDIANFALWLALLTGSALLISAQAVGVLGVQIVWCVDYLTRLVAGFHPVGGTEYMFDASRPLFLRGLSLFHLATPPLLIYLLRRLGYDRRGWLLETSLVLVLLPATYLLTDPADNINWLDAPFGVPQTWLPPLAWLGVTLAAYPLVLFLPTHLALKRLFPEARS